MKIDDLIKESGGLILNKSEAQDLKDLLEICSNAIELEIEYDPNGYYNKLTTRIKNTIEHLFS